MEKQKIVAMLESMAEEKDKKEVSQMALQRLISQKQVYKNQETQLEESLADAKEDLTFYISTKLSKIELITDMKEEICTKRMDVEQRISEMEKELKKRTPTTDHPQGSL